MTKMHEGQEYFTSVEAGRKIGVHNSTVSKLVRDGKLKAIKGHINGKSSWLVDMEDAERVSVAFSGSTNDLPEVHPRQAKIRNTPTRRKIQQPSNSDHHRLVRKIVDIYEDVLNDVGRERAIKVAARATQS